MAEKDRLPMMKKFVQDRIAKALGLKSAQMDNFRKSFDKQENDDMLEKFCRDETIYCTALIIPVKAETIEFYVDKMIPMHELPKLKGK